MNTHKRYGLYRLFSLAAIVLVASWLSGCHTVGIRIGHPHGHAHGHVHAAPPPYSTVVYPYYYYPDLEVYFDTRRKVYFYYNDGAWASVTRLPRHYRIHRHEHVVVNVKGRRPWVHHRRHVKRYPRNKWRKNHKHRHERRRHYDD